jgi:glyoxylase-like metal-dependent hydrolase (beta-lactamase superfamily II)
MRKLLDGVWVMERLHGCNTYLVGSSPDLALIDAGLASDAPGIESQVIEAGFSIGDVRRIVLTHAHEDHTGGAPELADRSGARVLAHMEEIPFIQQNKRLPAASAAFRLLCWIAWRIGRRGAICRVDTPLGEGDRIESSGLSVVHCPGHTPGSLSLYDADRRILLCGDALFNLNPMTGKAGLQVSIPLFTSDDAKAMDSVRMLARMNVDILLPGHGQPILEKGGDRIRELLSEQHHSR